MFMQVVINTTSYFDETDGTVGPGLPGSSSPYPKRLLCEPRSISKLLFTSYQVNNGTCKLPFITTVVVPLETPLELITLRIAVFLIPKTFVVSFNTLFTTVYDALIATKLVEMGVAVRPENVDWYKRQLLEGTV